MFARLGDVGGAASPYDWLLDALPATARPVLDLACGSAPLAGRLADRGYVGLDRSAAELTLARSQRADAVLVRGDALALPLRRGFFGEVVCSMALFLLVPLERVLSEVVRVLRPGGALVVLVPDLSGGDGADAGLHAAVLADLGRAGVGYPEPLDPASLGERFASCGLDLMSDEPRRFSLTLTSAADARLLADSYYAPAAGERERAAAAARLAAGPGEIGYPLRRIAALRLPSA